MSPSAGPRAAALPLGLLLAAVAAAGLLQAVFNPFTQHIPLCAVKALTGLDCPGCGATRAVHALLEGDLLLALQSNAMLVLLLPAAIALFADWTLSRYRGRPMRLLPKPAVLAVLVGLALVFGVVRNLPAFAFLAAPSFVPGL